MSDEMHPSTARNVDQRTADTHPIGRAICQALKLDPTTIPATTMRFSHGHYLATITWRTYDGRRHSRIVSLPTLAGILRTAREDIGR